jgi:hypothetical protein
MVSPTPNKKARKDEHHDEYWVMKGRLRGEEEIDALLWCNLMTPTNFDNDKNHFPMRETCFMSFEDNKILCSFILPNRPLF